MAKQKLALTKLLPKTLLTLGIRRIRVDWRSVEVDVE